MTWEIAKPRSKKFKIFVSGPPGCFKTRLALRLANNGDFNLPTAAVVDTEFGTDHYADQFAFYRKQTNDPEKIFQQVRDLVKDPGNIRTLIFDSFSVYYDALMEMWIDRFQLREKTSAGNKGEYYTLQPRDYVHPNRDAAKLVRMLLKCDLNIICNCQVKDQWEGMKVVGSVFDGWKRLPYYFDTVIAVEASKKKDTPWMARIDQKDRSYSFKLGEAIPWGSDQEAYDFMVKKMGQDLSGGKLAASYDPETDTTVDVKKEAKSVVVPETKKEPEIKQAEAEVKEVKEAKEAEAKTESPVETKKEPEKESETKKEPEAETKAKEKPKKTKEPEKAPEDPPAATGPAKKDTLFEIVRLKKEHKINAPDVWLKMVKKYNVETARDMSEDQAQELIKDIIRGEIPT